MDDVKSFDNINDAADWMVAEVNDPCIDNIRFAFEDDAVECEKYAAQVLDGCCGFFDKIIIVDGKRASIGCNYGH